MKPKAWVTTGTFQSDLQKVGEGPGDSLVVEQ